jgi:PAS domain-containing protein
LANGSPAFLCWGSDHLFFGNDAFKSTAGAVEIPLTGAPCSFTWPSLKADLERLYKQVSLAKEAAELGTFDMDLATGKLEWDARCRELFGIKDGRPVDYDRDFVQGLHLEDRDRVLAAIDDVIYKNDSNGEYDVVYRTLGADDEKLRWIRAKGKVYHDEHNKGSRFIGSVLDVTDQKYSELKSRIVFEKQARLAAIVDSSDDIIISKQLDGTITSWNASIFHNIK